MTATLTTAATGTSTRTGRKIWKTGLLATGAAAVATTTVAGVAHAAGVPLTVGGEEIALPGFAMLTAVFSVVGIVLASALARWARRPQRTFVITTVALTALSLLPDASADASTATRLVLALTHVVAAAIVIPAVASRLAD
jgi:hypothetical protein